MSNKKLIVMVEMITMIIALMFIPTFSAWAGTVSLPQTGQTSCWDTNGNVISCAGTRQDGDIRAGVAWPNPRFTDNGNQTMTDNLTGLIWAKNAGTPTVGSCTGGNIPWTNALDYIACLNTANYLGHNDWRLPNINELESLVNAGQYNIATWLGTQGFTNVRLTGYWSSTTVAKDTSKAWVINMPDYATNACGYCGGDGGNVFGDNKSQDFESYVWPVRSGQSGAFGNSAIWKTGQTQSYHSGDDGAIRAGVPWPSPRFLDNGDGTVTDNLTGLMWTKNANRTGAVTWQQALDYVVSMNTGSGTYGYTDWRMPNRKEFRSLADYSQTSAALQSENPFTNVQPYYYWSSTTDARFMLNAWIVSMLDGGVGANIKSYNYNWDISSIYVWPVRTGNTTPVAATLVSPSGTITTTTPTYTWNAVSNATYYYLWVNDSTGTKIKTWYTAYEAGCQSGMGTCSVTPTTALANGVGTWWIETWSSSGCGPSSSGMRFTISSGNSTTSVATLISPTGTITTTPTYTWNAVSNATWYYLYVNDSTGTKITSYYTASQAGCWLGTSTCSVTPSTALASGEGTWWIKSWSSVGFGPWSNGMSFTVQPTTNSCYNAISVPLNSSPSGSIISAGMNVYYRVNVAQSGTLDVRTTGSTDTYGYLLDSNCTEITHNDNGVDKNGVKDDGYNFHITHSVTSGTYYIRVKHYSSSGTGSYGLNLVFLNLDSSSYLSANPYNHYLSSPSPNTYDWGQCTWFAWGRANEKMGISLQFNTASYPDAKSWFMYRPVDSLNLTVGDAAKGATPQSDSIAVWAGDNSSNTHGHVAYIESVVGNMVYFNEANVDTFISPGNIGGGYDGHVKVLPLENFVSRGTGIGAILGYIYLH